MLAMLWLLEVPKVDIQHLSKGGHSLRVTMDDLGGTYLAKYCNMKGHNDPGLATPVRWFADRWPLAQPRGRICK